MNFDNWKIPKGIELNSEFQSVLNLIENTKQNIFLTGKPGVGKSSLIKILKENTKKRHIIVAPTGIAAYNISATTIHSQFRFPIQILFKDVVDRVPGNSFFKKLQLLIIDEASMVRADIMDAIDIYLRRNGPSRYLPFGGVQILAVGDLYQLAPIVSNEEKPIFDSLYKTPYFFSANCFENFERIELTKIYRQNDPTFIEMLEKIRMNELTEEDFRDINSKIRIGEPDDKAIVLTTLNKTAKEINEAILNQIPNKEFVFHADIEGNFKKENCPAEEILKLKEGSKVMFIRNDPQGRWVNGTLGEVVTLSKGRIEVEVEENGITEIYEILETTWENIRYEFDDNLMKYKTVIVGSMSQFPIKLANAISIHKSQSASFSHAHVHLGSGSFAHGQSYVALSRVRTLDGLSLSRKLNQRDIILDPRVSEFMRTLKAPDAFIFI